MTQNKERERVYSMYSILALFDLYLTRVSMTKVRSLTSFFDTFPRVEASRKPHLPSAERQQASDILTHGHI